MEDIDKIKQRFELLKIARELLNEEYINRRAEDHNKWIAENDLLWRISRRNVPYPPFAQYPTDEEIVKAASNLYNFIYGVADTDVTAEPVADVVVEETNSVAKVAESADKIAEPILPKPIDTRTTHNEPTPHGIKKLLPGWIRRADVDE